MSSRRPSHAFRATIILVLSILTIQGLPVPPSPPEATAQVLDEPGQDPAPIAEAAVLAEPIPDAAREPADITVDLNGILDPALLAPDLGTGDSPADLISDERPVTDVGGTQMDVFSPGAGIGDHFAVVSAGIFNSKDADGRWGPAALYPDDRGWVLATEDSTFSFPAALGAKTPVELSLPGGSLQIAPDGVTDAVGTSTDRTVTYLRALEATDLVYEIVPFGYKETAILHEGAKGELSWTVTATGLELALGASGEIVISSSGTYVAQMPAPIAIDSATEPAVATPAYGLERLDDATYRISLGLDPDYLAKATYPVYLDPGTVTKYPSHDTYVNSSQPNNSFGTAAMIRTGAVASYRGFVRFSNTWQLSGRLIYSAQLWLKNVANPTPSNPVTAKRPTATWDSSVTWNTQPGISTTPTPVGQTGSTGAWFTLYLHNLYQLYNDGVYTDLGVRLESADAKTFSSENASGTANDPYLLISYNDMPNPAGLDTPLDTKAFETQKITLKINNVPTDPNGDEVLVRYQVTPVQGDWNVAESSAWTDEDTFEIPADWVDDGGTYYWRVQSADVCTQPDTLCSNIDGTGATKPWPASGTRSFTILARNWGDSERFGMWSESLGNSMELKVNEANGNAYLHVPIDRLPTPLGALQIGLSYNSQAAAQGIDRGLGVGWRLFAGPESSGQQLPVSLTDLGLTEGVKITLRSGGSETYPWRGGNAYGSIGAGSGVVRKNGNGTWIYRTHDGDVYTFAANGDLSTAKPVLTKPSNATGRHYAYTFDAQGHLTKITDPISRDVNFIWAQVGGVDRLTDINVWGSGHIYTLLYNANDAVMRIDAPGGESLRFYDNDFCQTNWLVSEVRNGQQFAAGLPGWRIENFNDSAPGGTDWDTCRVLRLYPPQVAGGTKQWLFDYGSAGYKGTTSLTTKLTDPRGVATSSPTNDYQTVVDFNYSGLPIRIVAPEVTPSDPDWITSMVWDANRNLLCSRSPQANALDQTQCQGADQTHEFNTEYLYDTEEPYRTLSRTAPAPSSGAARVQTTSAYDGGGTFVGLWAELFENPNLAGVPDVEGLWAGLDHTWGTGAPPGIGINDNWSVRLSGMLEITGAQAKTYEFRVTSDDGVAVAVANKVLMYCFGETFSGTNCGDGVVKKKLWPGLRPITIEFQEKTNTAQLKVEWDQGNGTWQVIPTANLFPRFGLLTSSDTRPIGSNLRRTETTYGYPDDNAKSRRLPDAITTTSLDPNYDADTPSPGGADDYTRRTEYVYDVYGRKTHVTRFDGTAAAAETIRAYTDDAVAETSCLTQVTDPEDAITTYVCDPWGDVTEVTQQIREVTTSGGATILQTAENRITTTTYDTFGRPTLVEDPQNGETTFDYDLAGRLVEQKVLLDDAPVTWAITGYAYNDLGASPTMTETLPDPDGGGSATSPVITHTFDWVGNEVSRTDARDAAWLWTTTFDAQNRTLTTSTPDPDGAGGNPALITTVGYTVNPFTVTSTDPAGVLTTSTRDQLGRMTQTLTQTLAPTLNTYDAFGGLTRTEVKSGSTVYSYTERTFSPFGKPYEVRTPWRDEAASTNRQVTTKISYDASGRRKKIEGPRGSVVGGAVADDRAFTYDLNRRVLTSTYWTSASQSYVTEVKYNDAGDRLQVRTQTDDAGNVFQRRRWTYTKRGAVDVYTELHGATPYTSNNGYDAGGRLITVADPRGCTIGYVYDRLSRIISQDGDTCGGDLAFTYLADGAIDRATNVTTGIYYDHVYDRAARLTQTKRGGTVETTYVFNTAGQLSSTTTAAGQTSYAYFTSGANKGLLQTVNDPLFTTGLSTYAYDVVGRVSTRTDSQATGGSLVWTRVYEPVTSRVDTQTIMKGATQLGSFNLNYDEAGGVISRLEQVGAAASDPRNDTTTYVYDTGGRMTSLTGPDPASPSGTVRTWGYDYDGAGNRESSTVGGVTSSYTLDEQGWPSTFDAGTPGVTTDDTTYTWDEAGNLEGIDAPGTASDQSLTVDAWGWITAASSGGTAATYTLDPFGRVRTKTRAGVTTDYTYEGLSEVVQSAAISGGATTLYVHTPGGPLAQKVGSAGAELYLRDLHHDVVGLVSASGNSPSARAYYSPWGEATWSVSSSSLGFQGQPTDANTTLVDMTTRSYVPSLGRFSSRDSAFGRLRQPLSLNQWIYTADNPVSELDLLGLEACEPGVVCIPGENTMADPPEGWDPYPGYEPTYDTWIEAYSGQIALASRIFEVPRSVIVGVLATEFKYDARNRYESGLEWLFSKGCGGPAIGRVCDKASFGAGQIQIRRAELVDSWVRDGLAQALEAGGNSNAGASVRGSWDGDRGSLIGRLRDESWNILYVAAYVKLLKIWSPSGTSWEDIYGKHKQHVGEYNTDPKFIRYFTLTRLRYASLDDEESWGTGTTVTLVL